MSTPSYIRAAGDPDYNFAYSDFTVEFFASTNRSNGCQTLFEITNNESAAANLFTSTRFLSVIESGNLNAYGIQITSPFYVSGNVSSFTSPVVIGPNDRLFYAGHLLQSNQYSVSGSTVTLSNVAISNVTTTVEVGQILFEVLGNQLSTDTMHFISAERFQNEFYLFLDGISQSTPVPAFNAIPSQVISNTISGNSLARFDSPALLTIGANKDGVDPLYGEFGDIKITNGVSRHVQQAQIQNVINAGLFLDANLGTQNSSINITGSEFVDSISSYTPEELVPGQIFDTLYLQVYQNDVSSNTPVLSFSLFKPTIMIGPTGSYSFTMPPIGQIVRVPWSSLDVASASVLVNGNAIPATQWAVFNSILTILASPGDSVEIIATGPTTYYDVSNSSVTTLTANLYANSTSINLANTDPFITPVIGSTANTSNNALLNVRGQIFINQECITYLYIDRTAKTLSGLMRGTQGTGVPNVHLANTRVVNGSYNVDLGNLAATDPRPVVWYAVPFANTSLQNTNTSISTVLVNSGGLLPVTPF